MKKSIIALFLLFAMLVTSFASCGKSGSQDKQSETQDPGKSTETENITSFIEDTLPEDDLNGFVFTVLYSNRGLFVISEQDEMVGDIIEDALFQSMSQVKERFHCEFERVHGGKDDEMAKNFANTVSGGDLNTYSMSIGHDYLTMANALKGYYADISSVERFNFDKPWWPEVNLKTVSIGDKQYVASSYLSYSPLQGSGLICFNKTILEDKDIAAPYDKVFNHEWYLEDLIDLAAEGYSDNDGDGIIDPEKGEVFGYEMGNQGGYGFQRSMNVVPILKDEHNMPYFGLELERADLMMDKLDTLTQYGSYHKDSNTLHTEHFGANATLAIQTSLKVVYTTIRQYENVTYGFLPMPMLDEMQSDYISGATDLLWGIPTTSTEHMREISTIIEALSCLNYNNVLPVFYEKTLKTKLSESEDDVAVLDIIRDTTTMSFAYFFNMSLGGLIPSMSDIPRCSAKGEVAHYVEENKGSMTSKLEELVKQYQSLAS